MLPRPGPGRAGPVAAAKSNPASPARAAPPSLPPACLCHTQGLPDGGDGSNEVDRRMSRLGYRLQLCARLGAVRAYVTLATALDRTLTAATYLLGYPVLVV
jgi:hypothetical protein